MKEVLERVIAFVGLWLLVILMLSGAVYFAANIMKRDDLVTLQAIGLPERTLPGHRRYPIFGGIRLQEGTYLLRTLLCDTDSCRIEGNRTIEGPGEYWGEFAVINLDSSDNALVLSAFKYEGGQFTPVGWKRWPLIVE